ncbi:MAG: hypothetical protein KDB88_03670, partial [Flavobacteriales bacterium]|nr:hypothetical protein [Flavobacteriales bacterium]
MRNSILFSLLLLQLACTAQFNGPESVEYDPVGDRYFVSNTGSNAILQINSLGSTSTFLSGLSASPYGLEIQGDTLFACMGNGVRGFDLANGAEVFNLSLNAGFPNGITSDGQYLYVTDFSAQKIFRVDVAANAFTTWVANTNGTPNGIVFDAMNNRLLVAFWGSNAAVKAYNRSTASLVGTLNTNLTNIDGIAVDCLGLIYVASWSPDRISIIDDLLISVTGTWTNDVMNPADMDYDAVNGLLCIPNSGDNTVTFSALPECTTAVGDVLPATGRIHPVPSTGPVHLNGTQRPSGTFRLLDLAGKEVLSGSWFRNEVLDLTGLDRGSYVMDLM